MSLGRIVCFPKQITDGGVVWETFFLILFNAASGAEMTMCFQRDSSPQNCATLDPIDFNVMNKKTLTFFFLNIFGNTLFR